MTTYEKLKEIDSIFHGEITKCCDELGFGFAFGKEQIEKFIRKDRELSRYEGEYVGVYNVPGSICRLSTKNEVVKRINEASARRREHIRERIAMDEFIEYELSNYECYYTREYLDMIMTETVRDVYPEATDDDFKRVFYATQDEHE